MDNYKYDIILSVKRLIKITSNYEKVKLIPSDADASFW